jgi:hypothetical protein
MIKALLAMTIIFSFLPALAFADNLTSGLVGWWQLNEGSGSTANDSSGNGNNGTLTNGPTWTSGRNGNNALNFNGVNAYIPLSAAGFNKSQSYSYALWVYFTSAGTLIGTYGNTTDDAGGADSILSINSDRTIGYYVYDGSPELQTSSGSCSANSWCHVVVTQDTVGSVRKIYINGNQDPTTNTHVSNQNLSHLRINDLVSDFGGSMYDVRVYNRVLSATEVTGLYNQGFSGLVGHWTFDEGSGSSAGDSSNNGSTGTLVNSPTWITGQIGNALNLNGGNQYVDMGNPSVLNVGTASFTMSLWAKFTDESLQGYPAMAGKITGGGANALGYGILITPSNIVYSFLNDSFGERDVSVTGMNDGKWHQYVMTVDRSAQTEILYVDGTNQGNSSTAALATLNNSSDFLVGSRSSAFFSGAVDDVHVYNRVLSANEIGDMYNAGLNQLVGWWKLDEGSGSMATDSTGNGGFGSFYNSPTYTTGKVGPYATLINGSSEDIATPSTDSISPKSTITLAAWVYLNANNAYQTLISKQSGSTWSVNYADYCLRTDSSGLVESWLNFGGNIGYYVTSVSAIPTGVWTHVAMTYDGSTQTIYINGISNSTHSLSTSINTSGYPLNIGNHNLTDPGEDLNGVIDDVRIYSRALSAVEIAGLANKSLKAGLVGWWKMDDGSGSSAADSSGNGNTGSLVNGPAWDHGKIGGAINFSATNQYVQVSGAFNFTSQDFSLAAWVYANTLVDANNGPVILYKGDYQNKGYYLQLLDNGEIGFTTNQSGVNQGTGSATGVFKIGGWHHVAVTRSGANVDIYYDGVDVTSSHATHINPASSTDPFVIGSYYVNPNDTLSGRMDDVRVYNRALAPSEVWRLYKIGARSTFFGKIE